MYNCTHTNVRPLTIIYPKPNPNKKNLKFKARNLNPFCQIFDRRKRRRSAALQKGLGFLDSALYLTQYRINKCLCNNMYNCTVPTYLPTYLEPTQPNNFFISFAPLGFHRHQEVARLGWHEMGWQIGWNMYNCTHINVIWLTIITLKLTLTIKILNLGLETLTLLQHNEAAQKYRGLRLL